MADLNIWPIVFDCWCTGILHHFKHSVDTSDIQMNVSFFRVGAYLVVALGVELDRGEAGDLGVLQLVDGGVHFGHYDIVSILESLGQLEQNHTFTLRCRVTH